MTKIAEQMYRAIWLGNDASIKYSPLARRSLDFLAGATYAIGSQQSRM